MKTRLLYILCFAAACATAPWPVGAQQADEQVTVAFSDPSRPGTVEIHSISGSMTVKGSDRKDVLVIARPRSAGGGNSRGRVRSSDPPPTGLRRLTQSGGFSVEEERNAMSIESTSPNRTIDFEVLVPTRTNLKIAALNNGVITIDNVDGDMELDNTNGPILMTGVAGTIVANSINGKVQATMTRVTAQKAMAFTSLNGVVDITLPASTKANLRLRSDMGDVFTDFDLQITTGSKPQVKDNRRGGGGRLELEVNKSIQGTINGGGPEIEMRSFNGNVYVRKGS
jgi:DUF4097 and DUF4098 domain-containing protein YvlB